MKNPNIAQHILDMKNYCEKILRKSQNITANDLSNDEDLTMVFERLFEIVGEAANRVPKDRQANYPQISWAKIIGLRNIISHGYDKISSERLLEIAKTDVPQLKIELDKIWLNLS